ncbi:hypothetical protein DFJ58DRAFT_840718 [Suillus subalutaceus]|uniref:uncharacterized protein n=1 Tax=Suillus subalutaceus TaxID=48586 RepID=UPI001B85CA7F|nr:uncharacterized protein DFJ58DRAFT_840718 [Suillus subalutaceus]KAG1856987.1 hypothetical protein DFJ58DRAFT_840718 [Suillus subalutaceus]
MTNSIAFQENWRPAKPIPRFLGAGSDTTAVAIMYVFMASACYPGKVQQKVQEQLDIVVSYDRVPTFDGYKSLPQIETFMFECLRWSVYLNNDKFNPQRWLNSKGKMRHNIKFPYSFGCRPQTGARVAALSCRLCATYICATQVLINPKYRLLVDAFYNSRLRLACTPLLLLECHVQNAPADFLFHQSHASIGSLTSFLLPFPITSQRMQHSSAVAKMEPNQLGQLFEVVGSELQASNFSVDAELWPASQMLLCMHDLTLDKEGMTGNDFSYISRSSSQSHTNRQRATSYLPLGFVLPSALMDVTRDVILHIIGKPKGHQAAANRYIASVILPVMHGKSTPTAGVGVPRAGATHRRACRPFPQLSRWPCSTATNTPEIITIHKMVKRFQMLMRHGVPDRVLPNPEIRPGIHNRVGGMEKRSVRELIGSFNVVLKRHLTFGCLLGTFSPHTSFRTEMSNLAESLFGAGLDDCFWRSCAGESARAVGRDRAPMFEDYNSLPQIEAFMLEWLHWRPVTTLGFAHCKALLDIGSSGTLLKNRICSRRYIATRSVFIFTTLPLWLFKIAQDQNPIDEFGFVDGVIAQPKRFTARFQSRFWDEASLRE